MTSTPTNRADQPAFPQLAGMSGSGAACGMTIREVAALAIYAQKYELEPGDAWEAADTFLAADPRKAAPDAFDALCADVLGWQAATFPHRTPHSITEHLRREAEELAKEPGDAEEMADVGLLLIAAADASGVDLVAAIRAKLEKNKLRKWGAPDAHGVVEHTD